MVLLFEALRYKSEGRGFQSRWFYGHKPSVLTIVLGTTYPLTEMCKGKGKAVPLQAWSGPEGSRNLRFPDFMTTAQDGGKVVSLAHRPPLSPRNTPGSHFC